MKKYSVKAIERYNRALRGGNSNYIMDENYGRRYYKTEEIDKYLYAKSIEHEIKSSLDTEKILIGLGFLGLSLLINYVPKPNKYEVEPIISMFKIFSAIFGVISVSTLSSEFVRYIKEKTMASQYYDASLYAIEINKKNSYKKIEFYIDKF